MRDFFGNVKKFLRVWLFQTPTFTPPFIKKTNMPKQVDSRFIKKTKDLYGDLNVEVDKVFKNAPELRKEFSQVSDDFNFVNKRFRGDPVRPDADTSALLRLSSNKGTKKVIQRIDDVYGSNLNQAGVEARSAFQFADPSLIPGITLVAVRISLAPLRTPRIKIFFRFLWRVSLSANLYIAGCISTLIIFSLPMVDVRKNFTSFFVSR